MIRWEKERQLAQQLAQGKKQNQHKTVLKQNRISENYSTKD